MAARLLALWRNVQRIANAGRQRCSQQQLDNIVREILYMRHQLRSLPDLWAVVSHAFGVNFGTYRCKVAPAFDCLVDLNDPSILGNFGGEAEQLREQLWLSLAQLSSIDADVDRLAAAMDAITGPVVPAATLPLTAPLALPSPPASTPRAQQQQQRADGVQAVIKPVAQRAGHGRAAAVPAAVPRAPALQHGRDVSRFAQGASGATASGGEQRNGSAKRPRTLVTGESLSQCTIRLLFLHGDIDLSMPLQDLVQLLVKQNTWGAMEAEKLLTSTCNGLHPPAEIIDGQMDTKRIQLTREARATAFRTFMPGCTILSALLREAKGAMPGGASKVSLTTVSSRLAKMFKVESDDVIALLERLSADGLQLRLVGSHGGRALELMDPNTAAMSGPGAVPAVSMPLMSEEQRKLLEAFLRILAETPSSPRTLDMQFYQSLNAEMATQFTEAKEVEEKLALVLTAQGVDSLVCVNNKTARLTALGLARVSQPSDVPAPVGNHATSARRSIGGNVLAPAPAGGNNRSGGKSSSIAAASKPSARRGVSDDPEPSLDEAAVQVLRGRGRISFKAFGDGIKMLRPNATAAMATEKCPDPDHVMRYKDAIRRRDQQRECYIRSELDRDWPGGGWIEIYEPGVAIMRARRAKQRAVGGARVRKTQGPKLDKVTVTNSDEAAMPPAMREQYELWKTHNEAARKADSIANLAGASEAGNAAGRAAEEPCHMCMRPTSCTCQQCSAAFCNLCIKECYVTSSLTVEDLRQQCPVCRQVCICEACGNDPKWRDMKRFQGLTPVQRASYAKYVLALTKPQLEKVQRQQAAAKSAAGVQEPPRVALHENDQGRINCDGCNTSIADMCWCCTECQEVDLCLTCAEELRGGRLPLLLRDRFKALTSVPPVSPDGKLMCPCQLVRAIAAGRSADQIPGMSLQTMLPEEVTVDGILASLPPSLTSLGQDVLGERLHAFMDKQKAPAEPEPCPWCCWLASLTVPDASGVKDLRTNPNLRRAAQRGKPDDWLWTPHMDDVNPDKLTPAQYEDVKAHFQWHFRRRQFPIVRGLTPTLAWSPGQLRHLLMRQERKDNSLTNVLWCRDGATGPCSADDFVAAFSDLTRVPFARGSDGARGDTKLFAKLGDMLKLKDWPSDRSFGDAVPRHCADFITMLPFPEYTNMQDGPLNLAAALPKECCPPDLGPKSYVAYGVQQERGGAHGGDSVTRLHEDMSDAVNVLLHSAVCDTELARLLPAEKQVELQAPARRPDDALEFSCLSNIARAMDLARKHHAVAGQFMQCLPNEQERKMPRDMQQPVLQPSTAGAIWHTFRREDTDALGRWLMNRLEGWKAEPDASRKDSHLSFGVVCSASEVDHPIHSQAFYLGSRDLAALKEDTGGLEPWGFYQYDGECVFIPAGCPHQVRNTRSCIKVALDFVSPEAVRECAVLSVDMARIGMEDKLQGRAMLLHGAFKAVDELRRQEGAP